MRLNINTICTLSMKKNKLFPSDHMTDKYRNYSELQLAEVEGQDYNIKIRKNNSDVLIIAPHGGKIEILTSEIVFELAEEDFSYYCFEGLKRRENKFLHITSHNFDEPIALEMVQNDNIVLAIHGEKTTDEGFLMIGGLDFKLREYLNNELIKVGFIVKSNLMGLAGEHPLNICNRGKRGLGVQLEISRGLRKVLKENSYLMKNFVNTICSTLKEYS